MAWVEAAAVYYLRSLIGRIEPYQPDPLPEAGGFGEAEVVRELATLVMLLAVGWLAGKNARSRLGYAVVTFGLWDIFYYVFLRVITGWWPRSLSNWDILFLIPLPWWGPVWAPMSIAFLMILWGTFVTQFEHSSAFGSNWKSLALGGDPEALKEWAAGRETGRMLGYAAVIFAGAGLYGAAMGYWRSPLQAGYNLLKFPLVILATAFGNALLNGMLAPLLGLNLRFRQSLMLVLMSFTIAAAVPGSVACSRFLIICKA